jgi:hypothetical protein
MAFPFSSFSSSVLLLFGQLFFLFQLIQNRTFPRIFTQADTALPRNQNRQELACSHHVVTISDPIWVKRRRDLHCPTPAVNGGLCRLYSAVIVRSVDGMSSLKRSEDCSGPSSEQAVYTVRGTGISKEILILLAA